MSNITNYLNKVKTAIYGKEVRGAIHDAIKQVYDDASVEHDNANMEVKLARGTHNTLNDRLDNVDEIQAQTNAQLSSVTRLINHNNLDELMALTKNSNIAFEEDLIINKQYVATNIAKIDGRQRKFTIDSDGLLYGLVFDGIDGLTLENIIFDCNLKGRGSIHLKNCKNVIINQCNFTGYTNQYGYGNTDSCVLLDSCENVTIKNCEFYNNGFDLGIGVNELNRCVTTQSGSKNIHILNNSFVNVNQAIVGAGGSLIIDGNKFINVKDNSIYTSNNFVKITNNLFNDEYDESLVIAGGYYEIYGNTFINIPSRAITFYGNITGLNIHNNTFINSLTTGSILSTRDINITCSFLKFHHNTINYHATNHNDYMIWLPSCERLDISHNEFSIKLNANQRLIKIDSQSLSIANVDYNNVINVNTDTNAWQSLFMEISQPTSLINFNYDSNCLKSVRCPLYSFVTYQGVELQQAVGYVTNSRKTSVYYIDNLPTHGVYKKGDKFLKMTNDNKIIGWECVVGGDISLGQGEFVPIISPKTRSRGGTPINWLAPLFIGEIVFDSTNNEFYIGTGLTQTDWKKII